MPGSDDILCRLLTHHMGKNNQLLHPSLIFVPDTLHLLGRANIVWSEPGITLNNTPLIVPVFLLLALFSALSFIYPLSRPSLSL